jgi:ribonuclease HII
MEAKRGRKTASLLHEHQMQQYGCRYIVGMDEAGRGAWAGPVAAGAVCLPLSEPKLASMLKGVHDSKQLSPLQRGKLIEAIQTTAITWGVGMASSTEIDEHGINAATYIAMQRALSDAQARTPNFQPDALFLDAILWPEMRHIPQVSLIGGDARSLTIAAASILAKVARDAYMDALDVDFPEYGFSDHKGYGVAKHSAAMKQYGVSAQHRTSYEPVRRAMRKADDDV